MLIKQPKVLKVFQDFWQRLYSYHAPLARNQQNIQTRREGLNNAVLIPCVNDVLLIGHVKTSNDVTTDVSSTFIRWQDCYFDSHPHLPRLRHTLLCLWPLLHSRFSLLFM